MAIQIGKEVLRNIQEQVAKNKADIAAWQSVQSTLDNFGIKVLGTVESEADIPEQTYVYGDAWLVGEEAPYDLYIWTRDDGTGEFVNIGPLVIQGPQGNAGTITIGTVSTGEAGTDVIIENVGTAQNAILNITIPRGNKGNTGNVGATGPQGPQGIQGIQGPQGIQGIQGPQGDPGESFMIMGTISSTSQLPDPSETPRNNAYVLDDGDPTTPNKLYYITGAVGSEVWSYSSLAAAGTTVSVDGNPVTTWNANTKQNALTTTSVNDGTIVKGIGFNSSGDVVKAKIDSGTPVVVFEGTLKLTTDSVVINNVYDYEYFIIFGYRYAARGSGIFALVNKTESTTWSYALDIFANESSFSRRFYFNTTWEVDSVAETCTVKITAKGVATSSDTDETNATYSGIYKIIGVKS